MVVNTHPHTHTVCAEGPCLRRADQQLVLDVRRSLLTWTHDWAVPEKQTSVSKAAPAQGNRNGISFSGNIYSQAVFSFPLLPLKSFIL